MGVRHTSTHLLGLIASSSPNIALTYFSPKSEHRFMFFPPPPGACWVWHIHCQSCTCNTLTCIPMNPSVLPPTFSPYVALSSDSTEHHHQAHFSPNSADNAGEPPRSYRPCLLTKNFLAGPYNYRLITGVENITAILFLVLVLLSSYLMPCTWDICTGLEGAQNIFISSYLLAWHCLQCCLEPLPELRS